MDWLAGSRLHLVDVIVTRGLVLAAAGGAGVSIPTNAVLRLPSRPGELPRGVHPRETSRHVGAGLEPLGGNAPLSTTGHPFKTGAEAGGARCGTSRCICR